MIRVVAAIIRREGRVLACRRPAGSEHSGRWEFPGGKVEPGESGPQALRRELREELAIDADIEPLVWKTVYAYPGRPPVEIDFYEVERFAGDVDAGAFAEVCWALPESLPGLDFLEADRELVEAVASGALPLDDLGRAMRAAETVGRRQPIELGERRTKARRFTRKVQGSAAARKSSSDTGLK